ncbi:MAG: extracellular solute-binding protein [Clostridia bacterium]|nr:extracellular solute-binding protein [Clostridia bacterium]
MFKLKKLLASALLIAMTVPMLSGCGGDKSDTANGDKPVIKVLMNSMASDPNQSATAKTIEEKTGYKIVYETLPQDRAAEKLNLIMAGGDSYDYIITTTDMRAQFADYAKQGALLEVEDLIKEHGENLLKYMTPESFDMMRIDGTLYGIPVPSISISQDGEKKGSLSTMLSVRKDWMEKVGITEKPQTIDEFTAMLQAFKDKDPGNNGSSNAPLSLVAGNLTLPGVQGAFGIPHEWNEVDGKLVNIVEDPRYLEYIKYLKKLFDKGLLDPEFPTNKAATVKEKFTSGKLGIRATAYYDMGSVIDSLDKNCPGAKVEYLDALKDEDGNQHIGLTVGALDRLVFIPKSAKNPEHAIKLMNLMLEPDNFREIAIGKEGVHYTVKDGEYWPIIPKFFEERGDANNFLTGIDEEKYPIYWQARVKKDERVYEAYKYMQQPEVSRFGLESHTKYAPYFDSDKYTSVLSQISSDYFTNVIVGADSLDTYPEFLKKWKKEGGAAKTKELNEWYKKNKK